jgi:TatD DNase family protein
MLVDSHVHLQFPQFEEDRQEVIDRAADAGVSNVVVIGTDLASSREAVELAERNGFCAAVGFHPHVADSLTEENLEELKKLTGAASVVAVGEIGLDYYRNLSPRDSQVKAFRQQLELAVERGLPAVIHSRNAHHEVAEILGQHGEKLKSAVLHCYAGGIAFVRFYLDREFYFGVSGQITYGRSETLRATVRSIPIEKILLETDAPYLTPQPVRGRRNEPCFLTHTARCVAELKGMSYDEVCRVTSSNAARVFSMELSAAND